MPLPSPRVIEVGEGRTVDVRPGKPSDARGWIDLLVEVSREDRYILLESVNTTRRELARIFRFGAWSDQTAAIVAVSDSKVIGQLTTTRNRNIYAHTAEIGMSVQSQFRGKGVGAGLVEGAKDWSRIFGVEKLVLNVVPENTRAIRFYEKIGFVPEGHRKRHAKLSYGYEDLIEMSLWVDDLEEG
ncbi:MAG TPA: GNAT family N-acetyltransferase [Actinomycetota bacterium]|nr:GNAT family N-acetyltransferase [Actinomycetota bacterium]